VPIPFRDAAYICFLGVGAAVAVLVLVSFGGGEMPEALGRFLLTFVLAPLTALGLLAGLTGMALTLWVRTDPRLWALSIATAALFVLWVRHGTLGVSPRLSILHSAGAVLFSIHWLAEKRAARKRRGGARAATPPPDDEGGAG